MVFHVSGNGVSFALILEAHPLGQPLHLTLSIDTGQRTVRFDNYVVIASEQVFMKDARRRDPLGCCFKRQHVIVAGRRDVAAADVGDDHQDPLLLELAVVVAGCAKLLDAAHFEIRKIIRVMDAPLGIRFLVANSNLDLMLPQHLLAFQRHWGSSGERHVDRTYVNAYS